MGILLIIGVVLVAAFLAQRPLHDATMPTMRRTTSDDVVTQTLAGIHRAVTATSTALGVSPPVQSRHPVSTTTAPVATLPAAGPPKVSRPGPTGYQRAVNIVANAVQGTVRTNPEAAQEVVNQQERQALVTASGEVAGKVASGAALAVGTAGATASFVGLAVSSAVEIVQGIVTQIGGESHYWTFGQRLGFVLSIEAQALNKLAEDIRQARTLDEIDKALVTFRATIQFAIFDGWWGGVNRILAASIHNFLTGLDPQQSAGLPPISTTNHKELLDAMSIQGIGILGLIAENEAA